MKTKVDTIEELATMIAVWYSSLLNLHDAASIGKKQVLVSVASQIGFRVFVQGPTVILKSWEGSFQVCS